MKRRISIFLLIACLLLSTLVGCAPVTPPIDDSPAPTPDTTAADTATPNADAVEHEIELFPCIDNSVTFTSLSEMKEQLTAMKALPATDARYEEYAVLNTQELQYYYQPNLPAEFELVHVEVYPNLFIYTYEVPGKTGIVDVLISRIQEEDPLLDIERVTKQGRWKGYIFTGNTNWSDLYFTAPGGYLVKVSASRALLKELGLDNDEWKALEDLCSLDSIRTVRINTDHVTE